MIAQINLLIHSKLLLLFSATNHVLHLNDFRKTPKSKLQEAKILAEMMQRKDLIRPYLNREMLYELTEFGKQICENGGWLQHLEDLKKGNKTALIEAALCNEIDRKTALMLYLKSIMASITFNKNKGQL